MGSQQTRRRVAARGRPAGTGRCLQPRELQQSCEDQERVRPRQRRSQPTPQPRHSHALVDILCRHGGVKHLRRAHHRAGVHGKVSWMELRHHQHKLAPSIQRAAKCGPLVLPRHQVRVAQHHALGRSVASLRFHIQLRRAVGRYTMPLSAQPKRSQRGHEHIERTIGSLYVAFAAGLRARVEQPCRV